MALMSNLDPVSVAEEDPLLDSVRFGDLFPRHTLGSATMISVTYHCAFGSGSGQKNRINLTATESLLSTQPILSFTTRFSRRSFVACDSEQSHFHAPPKAEWRLCA